MVKLVNSELIKFIYGMRKFKHLLLLLLISTSITAFGQATKQVKTRKKILEKQAIEKQKAQEKAVEEGKKRHLKIQTKETRKRMKKSAKKAKRIQDKKGPKKKFFLLRIFG